MHEPSVDIFSFFLIFALLAYYSAISSQKTILLFKGATFRSFSRHLSTFQAQTHFLSFVYGCRKHLCKRDIVEICFFLNSGIALVPFEF